MKKEMPFSPIAKQRASHVIVDKIREAIANNHYKPGEQLPSERVMSEAFQVSRTVIREAISSLEASGLVEVRQGIGVFLKELNRTTILEKLQTILNSEKTELIELLELRAGLEREIVKLAVERANEEDIRNIEKAFLKMSEKMMRFEIALEEDFNFHKAIAEATHNSLILNVFNFIVDHYRKGLEAARKKSINAPDRNEGTLAIHTKLFLAIKNRDTETALKSVEELLKDVHDKLIND